MSMKLTVSRSRCCGDKMPILEENFDEVSASYAANLTKTPKRNVPNLLIGSMHEPPPDTMSSN